MWKRELPWDKYTTSWQKVQGVFVNLLKKVGRKKRKRKNHGSRDRKIQLLRRGEAGVEKGEVQGMEQSGRAAAARALRRLAKGRPNDAVKLAYLTEEQLEEIDRMDLTALVEFKRHGNGAVEVKLVDRAAILERLLELEREESGGAETLLRALAEESSGE